jgi:uncharacterized protein (DUF433 family)
MEGPGDHPRVAQDRIDRFNVLDGCYEAQRAAGLAGVPLSTVYDWARKGVIVPGISDSKLKLWSFADLVALRVTYWLRKPKGNVPATPMSQVRTALQHLSEMNVRVWDPNSGTSPVTVDRGGVIHLRHDDGSLADLSGQVALSEDWLDPLKPFAEAGLRGPDLVRPRPHLRIVPGKVAGEPHLAGSRLTTPTVAALYRRGFSLSQIVEMYPHENQVGIREAIELEKEISQHAA